MPLNMCATMYAKAGGLRWPSSSSMAMYSAGNSSAVSVIARCSMGAGLRRRLRHRLPEELLDAGRAHVAVVHLARRCGHGPFTHLDHPQQPIHDRRRVVVGVDRHTDTALPYH